MWGCYWQINANVNCDQKWNTIFYNNWDFETEILLDLIALSKGLATGQLCQEPLLERCLKDLILSLSSYLRANRTNRLCHKTVSQVPRNVSNNSSVRSFSNWFLQLKGGGSLTCRGKQTFCCTWSWFILLLRFWNGQFRRKQMWKLCYFTQRGVKLHKYGWVSIA